MFSFWGCVSKDIQQIQRDISCERFLKALHLFSHAKLPGKKRVWLIFTLPATSLDLCNFGKPFLFLEIQAGEQTEGFQTHFEGYVLVWLLPLLVFSTRCLAIGDCSHWKTVKSGNFVLYFSSFRYRVEFNSEDNDIYPKRFNCTKPTAFT